MRLQRFLRLARAAAALCALALFTAPAAAQTSWYANLTADQETGPPNGSTGTGFAYLTLNGSILSITATFSGLLGNTMAAHIHCCAGPGVNAGVATQVPSFAGFPLGVTSGLFNNTFDLDLAGSYNPAFITASPGGTVAAAKERLLNGFNTGNTYFNIHTSHAPGGEIRGQILVTPEPSTVALVTAGLLGIAFAARRRRVR